MEIFLYILNSIFAIAMVVLMYVSKFTILKRLNKPAWAVFIPFYSDYCFYRLKHNKPLSIIESIFKNLSIVTSVFALLFAGACMIIALRSDLIYFQEAEDMTLVMQPFIDASLIISCICLIEYFCLSILLKWCLFKRLELKKGYFIGLILFPELFFPIIAFTKTEGRVQ